ncbi:MULTISPECIES: response regulator [Pseudomonas]|jgi:hypothetical protein|uniref:Response regulatory domain-containing protein n=1 Tax=Pseudomonas fluorescens TaxID=294 RepID=A0A109KQ71_PSEFL|nr:MULTISPECIES: response regulator [Pseudomonas]KAA6195080.1 response regulator [Pseudomonas lactis]KWV73420.1 hypothetical protein PFL603g_03530 [Pseudomonas fluorescens]
MSKLEVFLLFVEDEEQLRENLKKEAEMFNEADKNIHIVPTVVSSIAEAKEALRTLRFDLIVTDLKIEPGTPEKDAVTIGNEFIRDLKKISPCPIAILTGKPSDVDAASLDPSSMANFIKDSDAEAKIFTWMKSKLPLIELMRSSYSLLNTELAPLFHGGVASRICSENSVIPPDSALRIILENVADSILTVNSTTKCHPQESYIFPVIRDRVMTGDLLGHTGETWVVLTPACDIVRCSNDYKILLAKCRGNDRYEKYLEKAKNADFGPLTSLINQGNSPKNHFLPPLNKGAAPYMVDFEDLLTVRYSDLDPRAIVAAVSPKFLPNLIHRFAAYLGRPGAPDIDAQHCLNHSQQ